MREADSNYQINYHFGARSPRGNSLAPKINSMIAWHELRWIVNDGMFRDSQLHAMLSTITRSSAFRFVDENSALQNQALQFE
jgi:hypothetical protein